MIMATVVLTVTLAQEKRYEIERAILKKMSNVEVASMKQVISSTQYFDNYGVKASTESVIVMAGQTLNIITIMKDGYMYTANMTAKTGTKINMENKMDAYNDVNYLNMTDEVKKKYQIEEKGNEQFLGKDCKRYGLTVQAMGQSLKIDVWVWKGLALKSTMTTTGGTITDEVTEIKEMAVIAKEKFDLPEGIEFKDMTPQK